MGYPTRTSSVRVCHFATSAGRLRVSVETDLSLKFIAAIERRKGGVSQAKSFRRDPSRLSAQPLRRVGIFPISFRPIESGRLARLVGGGLHCPLSSAAALAALLFPDRR